jgi:hypothetical protein
VVFNIPFVGNLLDELYPSNCAFFGRLGQAQRLPSQAPQADEMRINPKVLARQLEARTRDFPAAQRFAEGRRPVTARLCRIAKLVNHASQV